MRDKIIVALLIVLLAMIMVCLFLLIRFDKSFESRLDKTLMTRLADYEAVIINEEN